MSATRFILMLLAFLFSGASFARAQTEITTEYTQTEIVPEADHFTPGQTLWFAVRQKVRDGWHVFWVNPGDAGLPLVLNWTLPEGFLTGEILHPAPQYIPVGPLASYAHEGEVVFLTSVTAPSDISAGDNIDIEIHATWQVCEDICVPEEGDFEFSLPVKSNSEINPAQAKLFDEARNALPAKFEGKAAFFSRGAKYVLALPSPDDFDKDGAFFFPAIEGLTNPSSPQSVRITDGEITIAMEPGYLSGIEGGTLEGVLKFKNDDGETTSLAIDASVEKPIVNPLQTIGDAPLSTPNVFVLLVLAFFGGLILNVMPCVFPILFVKAASVMKSAHKEMGALRRHGIFYTLGVLATFLFIGGALLALRAGGEEIGWGFHLQSPVIVALSAYVLLLVGLSLSGVYTIGEGLAGLGSGLADKSGGAGAFFTGALAVVVAAPCIGPLLSAPMGAALLMPAWTGLMIFAVLALGLASPYFALCLFPSIGEKLPRPGPWMKIFKEALAFPVYAAAAYFLWVFSQQTSGVGLAFVLMGAVLLSFSVWLLQQSKQDDRRAFLLRIIAAIAAVAALAPLMRIETVKMTASLGETYGAIPARQFSVAALEESRAAGSPVFVIFTAAWCVTCQFDKVSIFSSDEVADAFQRHGVTLMVADWTVRDAEVTETLEAFGAGGVPFYVYYPANRAPVALKPPIARKEIVNMLADGAP